MAFNFEFAFLGRHHCYVASVTQVSASGYAIEPADTASFRLPESWTQSYEDYALSRYISDIRGHDFLSHTGRWTNENSCGFSPKSENIISEIDALRAVGEELEGNKRHKEDFKLSLGPLPGSFFADIKTLQRYRSEELPRGLKIAVENELANKGYGKISGVAMNATGGWVMHFRARRMFNRRKMQFCWGGLLPDLLLTALKEGRQRGAMISHMFLNHQHPDEFVLIFNDGCAHVSLHHEFEKSIKQLVDVWVEKTLKKKLDWKFTYSCRCLKFEQRHHDAVYYKHRALFFLSKSAKDPASSTQYIDLALAYLGEAMKQDPKSEEIRHIKRMALVAARRNRNDLELEQRIANAFRDHVPQAAYIDLDDSTADGLFRNQYLSLIHSEEDFQRLMAQVDQLSLLTPEWSYSMTSSEEDRPNLTLFTQYRNEQSPTRPRRPSELSSSSPVSPGTMPVELGSEQGFTGHSMARRRPPAPESPQIGIGERRPSELADNQISAAQRR